MEFIVKDYDSTIFKISLNKKYKTLKVYQYLDFSNRYVHHLIARNLSKSDIEYIEKATEFDLLYLIKQGMNFCFEIWN